MILNACLTGFSAVFLRLLTNVILLVFLAACQSIPKAPSVPAETEWLSSADFFIERRQYTENLDSWRYSATLGLASPDLNQQANLIWEFKDHANAVRIFGPLGVGAIKLKFDQFGVVLSDNKGLLHRGKNAEQLLTHIVGWPIPIEALSDWIFLLPAIGSPYRYRLNQNQQIEQLEQLGWLIEYSDYRDYQGRLMPRKIVASKRNVSATKKKRLANGTSAAKNGRIVVKLITKSWTL